MSYLIKKNQLKSSKYYRKKKLDIEELVDFDDLNFSVQEDLGIDKSIYGDDEGYILVARPLEDKDHYLVRFITLEELLENKVLKDFKIDNLDNIKKIPKRKLSLDDMDDTYVNLDITNIINELIEQYKTDGKKGIKLDERYTESEVQTTKIKKPKKEEKTEKPKVKKSQEELFENFVKTKSLLYQDLLFKFDMFNTLELAEYLTSDDYAKNSTQYSSALKVFKKFFDVGDLDKDTKKWNKILQDIVLNQIPKTEFEKFVYQIYITELKNIELTKEEKAKMFDTFNDRPLIDYKILQSRLSNIGIEVEELKKKLINLQISQILNPKKDTLSQIKITEEKLNIKKRIEQLWDLINGEFDGLDPAEGQELIGYENELLKIKIDELKKQNYDKEDIIEDLHEFPRGKSYSTFKNFEKILRKEGLLGKGETFEKFDDQDIKKMESTGSQYLSLTPPYYKSPLTIVKKKKKKDIEELKETYDFKVDPEMLKSMADILK